MAEGKKEVYRDAFGATGVVENGTVRLYKDSSEAEQYNKIAAKPVVPGGSWLQDDAAEAVAGTQGKETQAPAAQTGSSMDVLFNDLLNMGKVKAEDFEEYSLRDLRDLHEKALEEKAEAEKKAAGGTAAASSTAANKTAPLNGIEPDKYATSEGNTETYGSKPWMAFELKTAGIEINASSMNVPAVKDEFLNAVAAGKIKTK